MMYLEYENIKLPILDGCNITKSSQEITFSDIKCEFSGHTSKELPDRYQEVKVTEKDEILHFGYIDSYTFDELREGDEDIYINFTTLSPQKIATLRTCLAVGTYKLNELLLIVLAPLLDDGFAIKEINVSDKQITVNFLVETVEYCLNNLSSKFDFWWYIDEHKNIYIKEIKEMLKETIKHRYDNEHRIPGLEYIKPQTNSDNYANVINFKNVRVYDSSYYSQEEMNNKNSLIADGNITVKNGDAIDFNYPVDINPKNTKKAFKSLGLYTRIKYPILAIQATYSDGTKLDARIDYDEDNGIVYSNNIGIDGKDNAKEILLVKDSFFSNLIVGFKLNNENKKITKINSIVSYCILVYNVNKLYNDKGISEKAGKISKTGIVELTVDMNESWKTIQELAEIGSSYLNRNSLDFSDEIELKLDRDVLSMGETIWIDKLMISGRYVVTEIQINNQWNESEFIVKCKRANILGNYIDIFRGEKTQVTDDKLYNISITHYEEEGISESHEVVQ